MWWKFLNSCFLSMFVLNLHSKRLIRSVRLSKSRKMRFYPDLLDPGRKMESCPQIAWNFAPKFFIFNFLCDKGHWNDSYSNILSKLTFNSPYAKTRYSIHAIYQDTRTPVWSSQTRVWPSAGVSECLMPRFVGLTSGAVLRVGAGGLDLPACLITCFVCFLQKSSIFNKIFV